MKTRAPTLARALLLVPVLLLTSAVPALAARHHHPASAPVKVDPANFVTEIDNEFMPLTPGTTFHFGGEKDGVPATDDFHVTHRTRMIMGVKCVVVADLAFERGKLVEKTTDYFAQDQAGNVWYFGEDSTEFLPGGGTSKAGSWLAGVNGASPGIVMEAHPKVGDTYRQENAPGVAQDRASVLSVSAKRCVKIRCFDELLVTKDFSTLEPVVEHKYYAEGVGFIFSVMVKGGNERTQLISITGGEADRD